jgi:cysteine desulfurase
LRCLERARPGNPASIHCAGQARARELEIARMQICNAIGWPAARLAFTSGGTEANHLALKGLARRSSRRRVLVGPLEHPAMVAAAADLEREGYVVTRHLCDLDDRIAVVAWLYVHNETGLLQPIAELRERCRAVGAWLVCDGVAAVGRVPIAVQPDALTFSAHKFGGPRGLGGVLFGPDLAPLWQGGGQEDGVRPGTAAVPLAQAAAAALSECVDIRSIDPLLERLAGIEGAVVEGGDAPRAPMTARVCFHGVDAAALARWLSERGVMVSTGAACHSGGAARGIRISAGWTTTADDLTQAARLIAQGVEALRCS